MGSDPGEGLASVALLPREGETEDRCEQYCDGELFGGSLDRADGNEDRVIDVDFDPEGSRVAHHREGAPQEGPEPAPGGGR